MSVTKRFWALLICISLLCGCLISCVNPNPDENAGNTDQPLQSDRYIAKISIKYATVDSKMKAAIDALNTTSTLTVDGESVKVITSAALNDISTVDEYIYLDGVVYQTMSLTVGDKSVTTLERASMSAEQSDELISKAGPGAGISIGDFLNVDINTYGEIIEYSCSNMLEDSKESLRQIFAKSFDSVGAIVIIDSATYKLEVKDDRNHSSILSCKLVVTMDGVDYEVTMHLSYSYDYDAEISVTAPENKDAYTEVSFDEIIG